MTTYTWKVSQLERETSDGYVFTAHWALNAIETVKDITYTASVFGSVGLKRPEETLIPFEDLTEELVVSWIKNKLDIGSYEALTQNQIDEQKNPSKLSGVPW